MALHQRVTITFGTPLADVYQSVKAVRCPDCGWSFQAAVEYGEDASLLDVDAATGRLVDHARESTRPHPTILGHLAPLPRTA